MKHVVQQVSPEMFENWKSEGDENWKPSYSQLRNPEKKALQSALLAEQGWVCCYCGRGIDLLDSHIEHFRPQHYFEELQLAYENLHASCLREAKPGLPLHCGHAKKDGFDGDKIIDPLDVSCERRFLYTGLGAVRPADPADERAAYMIDLLALDIPSLRASREEALDGALDPDFLLSASEEDLKLLRDAFRRSDDEGKLPSFGHVLARYAEQYLPSENA